MLTDKALQKAIDVPLLDGVSLLISDQKYLCREVIRLRAEIAVFRDGMPCREQLLQVAVDLAWAKVRSPRVEDWLRRIAEKVGVG